MAIRLTKFAQGRTPYDADYSTRVIGLQGRRVISILDPDIKAYFIGFVKFREMGASSSLYNGCWGSPVIFNNEQYAYIASTGRGSWTDENDFEGIAPNKKRRAFPKLTTEDRNNMLSRFKL
jgi:hypothetical protein